MCTRAYFQVLGRIACGEGEDVCCSYGWVPEIRLQDPQASLRGNSIQLTLERTK